MKTLIYIGQSNTVTFSKVSEFMMKVYKQKDYDATTMVSVFGTTLKERHN